MKGLKPELMRKLQNGASVCHIPGIYSSIWTDMLIETTYLCLGHGPAGTIGLTTGWKQVTMSYNERGASKTC